MVGGLPRRERASYSRRLISGLSQTRSDHEPPPPSATRDATETSDAPRLRKTGVTARSHSGIVFAEARDADRNGWSQIFRRQSSPCNRLSSICPTPSGSRLTSAARLCGLDAG